MERVYLSSPHMGGTELKYIQEAFDANWISPVGPNIAAFENDLASYTGREHAAALSSGTAAIHVALILLGVKAGDEVMCSSFTFAGTCNPIVYQGAHPVFVDSEEDTWNMDPELLKEGIEDRIKSGKKPKAIIVVHLYGMPAKMDLIMKVAREFDIPVIEDAAEGLGASYDGKKLGSFGDLSILSFNGNKIITTSGGGALLSNNKEYIDKAKFLATQARDNAPHYEHSSIGYNYRLSNISAGIGRGQMEVLEQRVNRKREIFEYYKNELSDIDNIQFLEEFDKCFSNRWLTTILVDGTNGAKVKDDVRILLEKNNIESRPLWKPMHMQPVFEGSRAYLNGVSEKLFEIGLCLPSGTNTTDADLSRTIELIKECF
ncbi:aminotransferase class I/II-fold pyridoxal phosphate-dependent enzyme [Fulvivirga maritima]|uniref:aminotransferase class I/II-fold pyridoxal phosphate-dependent enzyme n=1 Tax=Fulvivirga maritima TaxID=2904247 RepID=UPI00272E43CF|nr:aminotransferase class I/II-fold pyridoxal phosphate-dependent enzyme [Fulvivirga maritima]